MDYKKLVNKTLKKLDRMYTQNHDNDKAKEILIEAFEEAIKIHYKQRQENEKAACKDFSHYDTFDKDDWGEHYI